MYETIVVGGGIVGLATARQVLLQRPGSSLLLIEKESALASHQTGHNSGVIHAGVYYQPGSLKARLCREGSAATKAFCTANGIAVRDCGKLIVATDDRELDRLKGLAARCEANGVAAEWLDRAGLRTREPAVDGKAALLVPESAIVDYRQVCAALAADIGRLGGEIRLGEAVSGIREDAEAVRVRTAALDMAGRRFVACAGLQSDRLARLAGLPLDSRIVPFRGEYFRLPAARSGIVSHLIYPVPDTALPFLGVHLTPMIDGSLTLGPNAVLGLAREGYAKGSASLGDLRDMMAFPGFWRLMGRYLGAGLDELAGSLLRRRYLERCRRYCASLTLDDLQPYPAGIRAQAVTPDGHLIHDFVFAESARMLHVVNAPSPAATAALPIAAMIVERLEKAG